MKIRKIGIISPSSGLLGEDIVTFQRKIGESRLEKWGVDWEYLPNSLKGIDFTRNYPEKRAEDLLKAFSDESMDLIFCAIGGDDSYKMLPYLFEEDELKKVLTEKVFLGFSDATMIHFMLHKLGLSSFYGQAFLTDLCELEEDMLEYSEKYFKELLETGTLSELRPSSYWYEERKDFSESEWGKPRIRHENSTWELLRGREVFEGEILGGCLETIFQMFDSSRNEDSCNLCEKYSLFPKLQNWNEKILFLETSENKSNPEEFRKMLEPLKKLGLFEVLSGVLMGQPQDRIYYEEYKNILLETISNKDLPILYNLNVGHSLPRGILPFGKKAIVDFKKNKITF